MHNQHQTMLAIGDEKDIVKTIKGNIELDGYVVICTHDGRSCIHMADETAGV